MHKLRKSYTTDLGCAVTRKNDAFLTNVTIEWEQLRGQKKRKKRYASGRDRRGQIVGRRPISKRLAHTAIAILVERKSSYALINKVTNKTSELVSNAFITK